MTALSFLLCSFVALLFEAFFSGSELALISSDRLELKKLADKGDAGAKKALELLQRPEQLLATTLVGTSLCIAFQATSATFYIANYLTPEYYVYASLILSPIVLIFGEIVPKTVFQRYSEKVAPRVSFAVSFARLAFFPITWTLGKYTNWLSHKLEPLEEAITGQHNPSHRDELRYLLTHGRKETTLKSTERKMIRRILDFSKAQAKHALIPLVNVNMVEDVANVEEALTLFQKYGHSRLPVYHERVDNIVGILHAFEVFTERDLSKPVTQLMKQAFYVPETQQLADLLYTMRKRGLQMGIIVDEYGGAVGIVTLEDILEEIVGDIEDEYDQEMALFRQVRENEYVIQAKMEIDALNENLKLNLPRGNYETLAGFLLQQFNRIPEPGDELFYGKLKFVILKATNRAIQTAQLTFIQD